MKNNTKMHSQTGITHIWLILLFLAVIGVIGFAGYRVLNKGQKDNKSVTDQSVGQPGGSGGLGDPNSQDPVVKGKALSNGQCQGEGSTELTHPPMDPADIDNIQPYGLMVGGHVTPVDHQYYYGKGGASSGTDAFPVYATADGVIVSIGKENETKWQVVISHNSCTFFSWFNLMTSLDKTILSQIPPSWGPNSNGGISIPVKAGQVIGRVGGQSLDFAVWDTTKTQKDLLVPIAYNNREPWKINTALPLDYFSNNVKSEILPKYLRTEEPRDGKLAYDIDGKAVGTWFLAGSNGYAGGNDTSGAAYKGHLTFAYNYIDSQSREFSTGDYLGQPAQFAIKNGPEWTNITPSSGIAKIELSQLSYVAGNGAQWNGGFAEGIRVVPGPTKATVLVQMINNQTMKVEIFPNMTPSQVSNFTDNAKTYNRGQDAQMVKSNTAT